MPFDLAALVPGKTPGFGQEGGIQGGVADVLDQGADRQLFDLRLGQALLATEGDDQGGRRDGVA